MPAAAPWIAAAVAAAGTTYSAIDANQQRQHAKGAEQAQQTQMDAQVKAADDLSEQLKKDKAKAASDSANATAAANSFSSRKRMATILTDPSADTAAPTIQKTLIGS